MNHLVSMALLACLITLTAFTVRLHRYSEGPRPFSAAGWACLLSAGLVAGSGWSIPGFTLSQMLAAVFPPLLLAGELQRAGRPIPVWGFGLFGALALARGVSPSVDPQLPSLLAMAIDVPLLLACGGVAWSASDGWGARDAHRLALALGLLSVPRFVDAWLDSVGATPLFALPLWAAFSVPTVALQVWVGLAQMRRESADARKALAASVQRFELIANGTLDLISENDTNLIFKYVSPSYRTVLGWEPEELLGTSSLDLLHPDDRETVALFGVAIDAYGELPHPPLRLRHRDGGWHVLEGVTRRYRNEDGEDRFVVINRDVTDRLRIEQQAQNAQRFKSLQLLAGGVAHDLNNLLVPIVTSVDLLRQDVDGAPEQTELLSDLDEGARRATELAGQLAELAGEEEGRSAHLDLSNLVGEVARLFVGTLPDRVLLRSKLSSGLRSIEGDPARLRHIVTNLLANAVEALGQNGGTIELSTGVVELDAEDLAHLEMNAALSPGPYVFLEVGDDGPGIAAQVRDRIFDPFVSTKLAGHGLGLSVLMGTVQSIGGAVHVRSAPGQGSVFRVLIPPAPMIDSPAVSLEPGDTGWRGHGTILLVDDEDTVRRATGRALASLGFSVVEAPSGQDAVGIFRRRATEIDGVVLDLSMLGLSGEQTYDELSKVKADIPVLLTSGSVDRAVIDRLSLNPRLDFLPKPYTVIGIRDAMRSLLDPDGDRDT